MIIYAAIIILSIASFWKIFTKAGRPGWASLVPIYNVFVLIQVASQPWWFIILLFVPLVNVFILIATMLGLAKNFGKGVGFAIGLFLLGFIFFPILGFGDSRYQPAPKAA